MDLAQALGICAEAAEHRSDMWAVVAAGEIISSSEELDCFHETDTDEGERMVALLDEASSMVYAFKENCKSVIEAVQESTGNAFQKELLARHFKAFPLAKKS